MQIFPRSSNIITWIILKLCSLVQWRTVGLMSLYICSISLYHHLTIFPITISQFYHCTIVPLHHCTIAPLHHCTIASLYHFTIAKLQNCTVSWIFHIILFVIIQGKFLNWFKSTKALTKLFMSVLKNGFIKGMEVFQGP